MQFREIAKVLGNYLLFFCLVLIVPTLLALYHQFIQNPELHPKPYSTGSFFLTILITLALAMILKLFGKKGSGRLFRREAIAAVVIVWFLSSILGALPFFLSGTLKNPCQAYFQGVSGFTTTGASVMEAKKYNLVTGEEIPIETLFVGLEDVSYKYYGTIEPVRDEGSGKILYEGIEAVSPALLFWSSLMQWLGGGGIMVLFVAILPALGVGGKVLLQSEVTGPIKDSLTPRIKETAIQLWKIYLSLSIIEVILLMVTNRAMNLFDAICITFSTISTGGFVTTPGNIGYWQNSNTEWIIILFMICGSINFSLYFFCIKGKFYKLYDIEFILLILISTGISLFAAYQLIGQPQVLLDGAIAPNYTFTEALRTGAFQLISAMTSTGFSTANYETWPYEIQTLMLIVMYVGGMSGSTAGGLKIIRHIVLFKVSQTKVEILFRPETVRHIKVSGKEIDTSMAINVLCYFFLAIAISVLGTFIYLLDGIDPETSIGLMSCMINNTGIAFRQAGAMHSFAFLSDTSCILSSFWMLLGRLEFFAILVLLIPAFWKEES
ncbi:TrkH family potassium uptake protein [Chlamydiales bacterium]|nr:TrkH family potassium uptake protein [Chlamydiales bacterium]